jgi:glucose-6-phosphate isomerase
MKNKRPNVEPFSLMFDVGTGICSDRETSKRYLSNMKGMYLDNEALEAMRREEDLLIYEFYELVLPEAEGDLLFGTSIVYPGKVNSEYFMTKGHFHTILDTAEVYYCLKGNGYLLMENPEGDWAAEEMSPGSAVYVPGRYAHRSINIGSEPLVMFFVFRADAGHDYGTIETKGFRKLIVEENGRPTIVDNPKWG